MILQKLSRRSPAALLAFLLAAPALGAWELSKAGSGIQVFTRPVAGSDLKEFRAVTTVNAPVNAVVSAIYEAEAMTGWWPDCAEARKVKVVSPSQWYAYFVTKLPFPLSNRDTVNLFSAAQNPTSKVVILRITGVPDFMPAQSGKVRLPSLKGSWTLTPKGETTEVQYQLHANPGGNIPAWLANSSVTDAPYKTLSALQNVALQPHHRAAKFAWLTRP